MSQIFKNGMLLVNGKAVVHTGGGGSAACPEECWVTVGPTQVKQKFINQARGMHLDAVTSTVFVHGNPIATIDSITNISLGDADSDGGVKSGTVEGPMRFLTCSPDVFFEGSAAVRDGDDVISNNDNTEISQWIQPLNALPAFFKETLSCPLEPLEDPKTINIRVLHSEAVACDEVNVDRSVCVRHQETGHKHYRMLNKLPEVEGMKLLHANYLREGRYTVEEVYPSQASGVMRVPLGEAQSLEKDDTTPCVELLPVSFMRYNDIELTLENIQALYEDTYLYIFKNGYLWRELKTDRYGELREIELHRYAGKDKRIEFPYARQGILLPLKDASGEHAFHIAVSHVQWSWAYIHLMGGLGPEDPRFEAKHYLDIAPDDQLIGKRLKPLTQADMHWDDALPTNRTDSARVKGGAVYVVDDPMGMLQFYTEELLANQAEEQTFFNERQERYITAQLVEQVLEAAKKEGKDYSEQVHHNRRYALMNEVDETLKSNEKQRNEWAERAAHYLERTEKDSIWCDYGMMLGSPYCDQERAQEYYAVLNNAHMSLMLTENGRAFLQQHVGLEISQLKQALSLDDVLGDAEFYTSKTLGLIKLFSMMAEVNQSHTDLILAFKDKLTDVELMVSELVTTIDSFQYYHAFDADNASREDKYFLRFVNGEYVDYATHANPFGARVNPAQISVIEVNGVPLHEIMRSVGKNAKNLVSHSSEKLKKTLVMLERNPGARSFIACLMLWNNRSVLEQIDKKNALGEIDDFEMKMFKLEVLNNLAMSVEYLAEDTKIFFTKKMGMSFGRTWSVLMRVITVSAVFMTIFIEVYKISSAFESGQKGIVFSHSITMTGMLLHIGSMMTGKLMLLRALFLGLSIVFSVIGTLLLLYFSLNEVEQWLRDTCWGRGKNEKLDFDRMLKQFHFMIPVTRLSKIEFTSSGSVTGPRPALSPNAGSFASTTITGRPLDLTIHFESAYLERSELDVRIVLLSGGSIIDTDIPEHRVDSIGVENERMRFKLYLNFKTFEQRVDSVMLYLKYGDSLSFGAEPLGIDAYNLKLDSTMNLWNIRKIAYEQ